MNQSDTIHRIKKIIDDVLEKGSSPISFLAGDQPTPVSVVPIKTSAPRRPDGLRADIDYDPGFSFAVAEALLVVSAAELTRAQLDTVHNILWMAGTDDWLDYSHFTINDATCIANGENLTLTFSSAQKAAHVVLEIFDALNVATDDIEFLDRM